MRPALVFDYVDVLGNGSKRSVEITSIEQRGLSAGPLLIGYDRTRKGRRCFNMTRITNFRLASHG